MVSRGHHTPQDVPWVIWGIGCGGLVPLEPPRCIFDDYDPFVRGKFSCFCLWIATDTTTRLWQATREEPDPSHGRTTPSRLIKTGLTSRQIAYTFDQVLGPFGLWWSTAAAGLCGLRRAPHNSTGLGMRPRPKGPGTHFIDSCPASPEKGAHGPMWSARHSPAPLSGFGCPRVSE